MFRLIFWIENFARIFISNFQNIFYFFFSKNDRIIVDIFDCETKINLKYFNKTINDFDISYFVSFDLRKFDKTKNDSNFLLISIKIFFFSSIDWFDCFEFEFEFEKLTNDFFNDFVKNFDEIDLSFLNDCLMSDIDRFWLILIFFR